MLVRSKDNEATVVGLRIGLAEEAAFFAEIIETQNDLASVELDPLLIMRMVTERSQKLTQADGATLQMLEGDHLICHAGTGIMMAHDGLSVSLSNTLAGHAVQSGQFQYAMDCENDPRVHIRVCREIGMRSSIVIPLIHNQRAIGVLNVVSHRPKAFELRHIAALRLMAGLIVASLSHAAELEIKKNLLADRTAALAAKRENEERFQSAFDHAAIGMALVSLDGRWLQVNESMCRIVGYSEAELQQTDFQSITFVEDLDTDLANVRQLIAGEIADYQMEKRYVHHAGHIVFALLSVSLVRDAEGKPAYFISQIQDITQRHHAEEALKYSEDEYRTTFELAGVGKFHIDLETGRFLRVNGKFCELTGYTSAELKTMTSGQLSYPKDGGGHLHLAARLRQSGVSDVTIEKGYIRKDGTVLWVIANAASIRNASGQAIRAVCTIQDITERKRAEQLESDRRQVLEMVAQNMPLPGVLDQMAETVERQIGDAMVAIIMLQDGNFSLCGPSLPADWKAELERRCLSLSSTLASVIWQTENRCGVTTIEPGNLWKDVYPIANAHGLNTCWSVTIQSTDGTSQGILNVFCRQLRQPTAAEVQTLDMCSKLATICLDHHQATGQLSHLVRHDRLTGLANRMMFEDRIQQALALAARSGNPMALMAIDLDKFKSINDTLGHHAGDQLLQQFSQRLSSQLRETDTMARIGGDEFVIVLPELASIEGVSIVAEKLLATLIEPFELGEHIIKGSCSIGIAVYPRDAKDIVTLMKQADEALYRTKEKGRNGYSF